MNVNGAGVVVPLSIMLVLCISFVQIVRYLFKYVTQSKAWRTIHRWISVAIQHYFPVHINSRRPDWRLEGTDFLDQRIHEHVVSEFSDSSSDVCVRGVMFKVAIGLGRGRDCCSEYCRGELRYFSSRSGSDAIRVSSACRRGSARVRLALLGFHGSSRAAITSPPCE